MKTIVNTTLFKVILAFSLLVEASTQAHTLPAGLEDDDIRARVGAIPTKDLAEKEETLQSRITGKASDELSKWLWSYVDSGMDTQSQKHRETFAPYVADETYDKSVQAAKSLGKSMLEKAVEAMIEAAARYFLSFF